MAAIGRDAAVEAAIAAIDGVERVDAAIAAAGLPGVRAARVAVLLREGRADASGPAARAALVALREAHGARVTGSIAVAVRDRGARTPVPAADVIAAAGLVGAAAAGGEVLCGASTRAEPRA